MDTSNERVDELLGHVVLNVDRDVDETLVLGFEHVQELRAVLEVRDGFAGEEFERLHERISNGIGRHE
jgi:hypothetical protein